MRFIIGKPREIFSNAAEMKRLDLEVPIAAELAERLRRSGFKLPREILTAAELANALKGKLTCDF